MVHSKSYLSVLRAVTTGVVKTSTPCELWCHRDELNGARSVVMVTLLVLTVTVMVVVGGGGGGSWRREESFWRSLPVWACLRLAYVHTHV